MKLTKIFLGLLVAGVVVVACYKGTPPCDPSTVDWPRCRPWDPPMRAHDGGAER